jgi:hypothetical protein
VFTSLVGKPLGSRFDLSNMQGKTKMTESPKSGDKMYWDKIDEMVKDGCINSKILGNTLVCSNGASVSPHRLKLTSAFCLIDAIIAQ